MMHKLQDEISMINRSNLGGSVSPFNGSLFPEDEFDDIRLKARRPSFKKPTVFISKLTPDSGTRV